MKELKGVYERGFEVISSIKPSINPSVEYTLHWFKRYLVIQYNSDKYGKSYCFIDTYLQNFSIGKNLNLTTNNRVQVGVFEYILFIILDNISNGLGVLLAESDEPITNLNYPELFI